MKFSFFQISLILVFLMFGHTCIGQDYESELIEKIEKYKKQDRLEHYALNIDTLIRFYKKKFGANSIDRYKESLRVFSKFNIYRRPTTKEESIAVRQYYGSQLWAYAKLNGQNKRWEAIAKEAHGAVYDKNLLDSKSWFIENQIGHYYAQKNDYDKAIKNYLSIIPGLESRNRLDRVSRTYSSIGDCYQWKENKNRALEYYEKGLKLAHQVNSQQGIAANLESFRSLALSQKEYSRYESLHNSVKDLLNKNKSDPSYFDRVSSLNADYAKFLQTKGEVQKAIEYLQISKEELIKFYGHDQLRYFSKLDLEIANNQRALGRYKDASNTIAKAFKRSIPSFDPKTQNLPLKDQLYGENTLIDLLLLKAQIYELQLKAGNNEFYIDSIQNSIESAILVNEILKKQIALTESKIISTGQHRLLADLAIKNLYRSYVCDPKNFDFKRLRAILNISKNQLVDDQRAINKAISRLSPELKTEADSLQQELHSQIGKRTFSQNIDSVNIVILDLRERLQEIISTYKKAENNKDSSEHFIEYHIAENGVFLFAKLNNQKSFIRLGDSEKLDSLFQNYTSSLEKRGDADIEDIVHQLKLFLIPDALNLPKEFTIIADGYLAAVPFDIFRLNDKYFIEAFEISIQHHFYIQNKSNQPKTKLLCISPNYTHSDNGLVLEPLPYNILESQLISKEVDDVRVDSILTSDDLVKTLEGYNIFHFAGHAISSVDQSYLVLNDGSRNIQWSEDQISSIDLNLDLVTLSACETGLGKLRYGDGLNSLSRSFLASGVHTVVYSMWSVNDQTTSELMKLFYKNLGLQKPVNTALREAKLEYLDSVIPGKRHPYYWAGFIATGDTELYTVHKKFWPFVVLGLLLSFFLLLLSIKHLRNR